MNLISILYALLSSLLHPSELIPLLRVINLRSQKFLHSDKKLEKCYEFLVRYSRSFSTVIICIKPPLRDYVCLLYLSLRALDTVEDHPGLDDKVRLEYLRSFHERMLAPDFDLLHLFGDSMPYEYDLIKEFKIVTDNVKKLPPVLKQALLQNVKGMGVGVADSYGRGCNTIEEYNDYVKYVAGYVGVALSKGFAATNAAMPEIAEDSNTENSIRIGGFLQKTNIIKDFRIDFLEGREFWPRCIVDQYLPPQEKSYSAFFKPENEERAFACLLHMVYDALELLPYAFEYCKMILDHSLIRLVLLPQTMAVSTLAHLLKGNGVFKGTNIKIRSGLSAKLMTLSTPAEHCIAHLEFIDEIHNTYVRNISNPYFKLYFEACAVCADVTIAIQKFLPPNDLPIMKKKL